MPETRTPGPAAKAAMAQAQRLRKRAELAAAAPHQPLAWTGVGLGGASVFLPAMHGPLGLSVSLMQGTDGYVILGIVGLAAVFTLFARGSAVAICGVGLLAAGIIKLFHVMNAKAAATAKMQADLADNPFRGLAEAAIGSMSPGIGLFALVAGGGLLIASRLYRAGKRAE